MVRRKSMGEVRKELENFVDYFQDQMEIEKSKEDKQCTEYCIKIISIMKDAKSLASLLQRKESMQ